MRFQFVRTVLCLFTVATLSLGCKETSSPPPTLSIDQVPGALEKAFSKAPPETKELSTQVVSAIQGQDYGKAYAAIQNLATKPGLTKEQTSITASGIMAINTALQSAQAQGDNKAAEVLQIHRRNK